MNASKLTEFEATNPKYVNLNKAKDTSDPVLSIKDDNLVNLIVKYSCNELNLPASHYAIYLGDIDTVEKLLPHTNMHLITSIGTALDIAVSKKHEKICEMLLMAGASITNRIYFDGATSSHTIIGKIIDSGLLIPSGDTLYRFLSQYTCSYEIVKLLTERGADCCYYTIMTEIKEKNGKRGDVKHSCLHSACSNRDPRILKLLLENGAVQFINEGCHFYNNPLAIAINTNNPETAKILVESGATANLINSELYL